MAETITPSSRMASRAETDQAQFLKRWLAVWVALLTVVVAVVVVFLIFITSSLSSIDDNLVTANTDVGLAGGNVRNLPNQVEKINGSLSTIDPALKPVPGQVDAIIGALTLGGILFALGSLVALVMSRTVGILGFTERQWTNDAIRATTAELGAIVAFAALLVASGRFSRVPVPVVARVKNQRRGGI